MLVAEASGVFVVDGAIAMAGGSAIRASRLGVPVLTGGQSSPGIESQAVAVLTANGMRTSDGGVMV